MSEAKSTPVHEWLRPRLLALVEAAERAGMARPVVVAVILDIIGSAPFDQAPPPQTTALPAGPNTAPHERLPIELETEGARNIAEAESQGEDVTQLPPPWL